METTSWGILCTVHNDVFSADNVVSACLWKPKQAETSETTRGGTAYRTVPVLCWKMTCIIAAHFFE
jgi:hypothetical protein